MQDGKIRDVFFIKFYPKKQEKHILLLANHTSDIKFKFSRLSTMKEVMITKYLCRLNYNEDKAEDIEDFTEKYKILDLDDFELKTIARHESQITITQINLMNPTTKRSMRIMTCSFKLENQVQIFKTNNYTIPKLKKELEEKQAKLKKENQKVEMLKEAIAKAQQSLKHRSIKINKDKLDRDLIQEAYKILEADYEKLKKEKQELIKSKKLSDKTLRLQIASLIKKNSIIKKLDQDIAEIEAEGPTKGPKLDIYDETYDSYVPSPNVQCMVCVGLNRPIIGKRTYTTCCGEFLELCEICFRASIAIFKDKCCPYCKRSYDKMRGQELFLEPTYWRSDQS